MFAKMIEKHPGTPFGPFIPFSKKKSAHNEMPFAPVGP